MEFIASSPLASNIRDTTSSSYHWNTQRFPKGEGGGGGCGDKISKGSKEIFENSKGVNANDPQLCGVQTLTLCHTPR